MKSSHMLLGSVTASLLAIAGCSHSDDNHPGYSAEALVADQAGMADHTDANVVNAWGIALSGAGPVWIANNHSNTSSILNGDGVAQVSAALPAGTVTLPDGTDPTGLVFNGTADFKTATGCATASCSTPFIFDGEGGTLVAWSPGFTDPTKAKTVFTAADGAVYKGLALASNANGNFLFATDFHNHKVDVFDKNFAKQAANAFPFTDPAPPQAGFAPFGIQAVGGQLFVTYAKLTQGSDDETHGAGLGYVNVFDTSGAFVKHFVSGGALNAPWGVAQAPMNFGELSSDILIGNFGDGWINAFDPATGNLIDSLKDNSGQTIVIDGLWGLAFGNGAATQATNRLFFTAGPGDEEHGLFGRIDCNC